MACGASSAMQSMRTRCGVRKRKKESLMRPVTMQSMRQVAMQHPLVRVAARKRTGGAQTADGSDARQARTVLQTTAAAMRTAIAGPFWTSVATAVPRGYGTNPWQWLGHMAGQVLVLDAMVRCLCLCTVGHSRLRVFHLLACHQRSLVEAAAAIQVAVWVAQDLQLYPGANGTVLSVATMAGHHRRRIQMAPNCIWAAAAAATVAATSVIGMAFAN